MAPCGVGEYGLIPVEATTQFVNAAYTGRDSDGTREKPWRRIQEGIDHARSGAIVAVAAGRYTENIRIQWQPVRLWGRCPTLVELTGTGAQLAALTLLSAVSRSTNHIHIKSLSVTGPGGGIFISGRSEVLIDRVRIHDTASRGLEVNASLDPPSVTVRDSLIEAATGLGAFVSGSQATIEATVIRATRQPSDETAGPGRGIEIHDDSHTHARANLTVRRSLLEQNHIAGVFVGSSDATIESTVIRGTQPDSDGYFGSGVVIANTAQDRASVTIRASVLEQNHRSGVVADGSDVAIEGTVIRGTQPDIEGTTGFGVSIKSEPTTLERGEVTIRDSLLEHNHSNGVLVADSNATIDATIIRDTQSTRDGASGRGIEVVVLDTHERSKLTLRNSLLERNHDVGMLIASSDATVEATVVRDNQPTRIGYGGGGIHVQPNHRQGEPGSLMLRGSLIEQNIAAGVSVLESAATIESTEVRSTQQGSGRSGGTGIHVQGRRSARATLTLRAVLVEQSQDTGVTILNAEAMIDACVVRSTRQRRNGTAGDGIAVVSEGSPSTVIITSTTVESNARAGISNFSAAVTLLSSNVQCNRIDLNGEDFVDGQPFTFDCTKGNLFGCETPDPVCSVLSAGLTPPEPISPLRPTP
ncbi:hypothetical protein BE11_44045 [Sorangium cellulosum]|nr:hypothetical protein BE11_44045 [Sorangium cellulosum]